MLNLDELILIGDLTMTQTRILIWIKAKILKQGKSYITLRRRDICEALSLSRWGAYKALRGLVDRHYLVESKSQGPSYLYTYTFGDRLLQGRITKQTTAAHLSS